MANDEFTKLFNLVHEIRTDMASKQDVSDIKQSIDDIRMTLDKQSTMLDTDETERLALSKQVDRLQDWADRTAPKVGVAYKHP